MYVYEDARAIEQANPQAENGKFRIQFENCNKIQNLHLLFLKFEFLNFDSKMQ